VLWDGELIEAVVVRVTGTPPRQQVHLVLPADPACPDADGPVHLVLHLSELPPAALDRLGRPAGHAGQEARV
jgi:hypothetical protein